MALTSSSVIRGRVSHTRVSPVKNRFEYGIDCLMLDGEVLASGTTPRLFSFGKPNLVSLQPSDHGVSGCCGSLGVVQVAQNAGIKGIERVLLLTHPRYWGYTFNPVSFWFLFNNTDRLRAVVAEVHNTFGDRHSYLCAGRDGDDINGDTMIESVKRLHVSPFFDVRGRYRFRFNIEEKQVAIGIRYEDGEGGGLSTAIAGERLPFTDRQLALALLRRPFGAARTTALIHWQALKLWRKGVRYRNRPKPPEREIST